MDIAGKTEDGKSYDIVIHMTYYRRLSVRAGSRLGGINGGRRPSPWHFGGNQEGS